MRTRFFRMFSACLAFAALAPAVLAQSAPFTYQGELTSSGQPANGLFDLRFRVYNASTGGTYYLPEVCLNNVQVTNGRFAVILDVPGAFTAAATRHLEVYVRADTGLDCTNFSGYTTLSPRQAITSAPRANRANVSTSLAPDDGSPNQSLLVSNAGAASLGAAAGDPPIKVLTVPVGPTAGEGMRIQGTDPGAQSNAYVSFYDSSSNAIGYVGDGSSGDSNVFLGSYVGDVGLVTTPGGRVLNAQANGALRLGTSSGDYRQFILGGGNSEGYLYGSYASLGDGIHMGYNYYADASGANRILHPDGGTSRITVGYGSISLATAPAFGGPPVDRLVVESSGRVTVGSRPVITGEENLRLVRGEVSTAGAISRGSGFTVAHPGTGAYTITFTPSFASPPTCTVTAFGGTTGDFAQVTTVTNAQATIVIENRSGGTNDQAFHFIAVGPR